jgi:hypothetical protein
MDGADEGPPWVQLGDVVVHPVTGGVLALLARRRRHTEQTGRLVDDDDRLVLVEAGERQPRARQRLAVDVPDDRGGGGDHRAGLAREITVDGDLPLLDDVARLTARELGIGGDQPQIESLAGRTGAHR